jgi:hypothetical protein
MTELSHRFPPPWDIDHNGACFIVRDANGQALKRSALLPSADQRWCLMNKVCIVDLFDKKSATSAREMKPERQSRASTSTR